MTSISDSEDILDKEMMIPTYKVKGMSTKPIEGMEYNTNSVSTPTGTEPEVTIPKVLMMVWHKKMENKITKQISWTFKISLKIYLFKIKIKSLFGS